MKPIVLGAVAYDAKVVPIWDGFLRWFNARGLAFDYPRKAARTMGRVALLAVYATEQALADAGLAVESLGSLRLGLAHGSTHGSSSCGPFSSTNVRADGNRASSQRLRRSGAQPRP